MKHTGVDVREPIRTRIVFLGSQCKKQGGGAIRVSYFLLGANSDAVLVLSIDLKGIFRELHIDCGEVPHLANTVENRKHRFLPLPRLEFDDTGVIYKQTTLLGKIKIQSSDVNYYGFENSVLLQSISYTSEYGFAPQQGFQFPCVPLQSRESFEYQLHPTKFQVQHKEQREQCNRSCHWFIGTSSDVPTVISESERTVGTFVLCRQTREVVNNIHSFMKSEAASGDFLIPLKKVQERVSAATKVPERTIRKIIKEGKQCEEEGTSFGTPGKVHRVPKRVTDVDDFDKRVIRQTIYNFYINDKTVPTVSKLLPKLKDAINFNGGSTSLKIILRDMGFKLKKTRNNKAVLQERLDIREQRVSYLRAIKKYREEAMNGHCVLRLPPYSPELNPLELIWADIKQWVAGQNTTFKLEQVMKLCQQRVDDISVEKWEKVCEHVEKIEDEYIEQEGIMENVIESFIIMGGDSSSESDDDEDDDHNENHDDNGGDISGIESLSDE
ncbi:hypothetical protein ANN_06857 [Periplaneta americana]|uniref:Tc1-like transposase DDE domain-containing protein n=1 Tax=Periplaneta americana TaxID=6978 RepID=A0ABQ8TFJ8_PERAM|nr:hypothetical protein ANN_06857 [Periplaneta americana]